MHKSKSHLAVIVDVICGKTFSVTSPLTVHMRLTVYQRIHTSAVMDYSNVI